MKARKSWAAEIMVDWLTFTDNIMDMNREDVIYALELENERARPRSTVLKRLTSRYNAIRAEEIKKELE